jgi:putative oxygen-independent coproporphyrinogen III oxidase
VTGSLSRYTGLSVRKHACFSRQISFEDAPGMCGKLENVPGLYVHIPFCARRCPYCDFAVSVNRKSEFRGAYVSALQTELDHIFAWAQKPFETVFFGGGTPTELAPSVLNALLDRVRRAGLLAPGAEVSLEANPENLDSAYLEALRAGGWNRISLGVQSLDAQTLQTLGRAHTPAMVEHVVARARQSGWTNLSLDLIFGAPGESPAAWRTTLERAVELEVEHLSCYSLTIESGTRFGQRVERGEWQAPDDDAQAERMETAAQVLGQAGFERYEVSNWAKPGFESRHNQNYWRGGDYFGAGCGAHSHQNGRRWWNERDSKRYIHRLETENSACAGEEILTPDERLTETVALGLRSCEGFALEAVEKWILDAERAKFYDALKQLARQELLKIEPDRVLPLPSTFAVADGVAIKLLQDISIANNTGISS